MISSIRLPRRQVYVASAGSPLQQDPDLYFEFL